MDIIVSWIQHLSEQFLLIISLLFLFVFALLFFYVVSISNRLKKQQNDQSNVSEQLTVLLAMQQQLMQSVQQVDQKLLLSFEQSNHLLEQKFSDFRLKILRQHSEQGEQLSSKFTDFSSNFSQLLHQHQASFSKNQLSAIDQFIEHLSSSTKLTREELAKSLQNHSEAIAKRFDELTNTTESKLKEISGQVEKRLSEGFEKTTKTFNDILTRLALIDDAQKKITELSTNVVSLQEVLSDKRSRGAFGEVQLNALIRNVLSENQFALQHKLSNGKIADCVIFLPEPTGNVVIDAKFPLESFRTMMDETQGSFERSAAKRQFKQDIKKHINDISSKYLIEKETSDGAIMFIPAEAVFAEIHAHHSDLVELANQQRVWLASPTTLMAILTTARSVLKDEVTRQQVHIIQSHLAGLSSDFSRFRNRFDQLAKHIEQASTDVKQIHTSATKISNRFDKIEQVDLDEEKEQSKTFPSSVQ